MSLSSLDIALFVLVLIVAAVGIATRSTRFPYPVALVLTGLALSIVLHSPLPLLHDLPLDELRFTPHLILVVFLPALLFEATLQIEATTLRKTLLPMGLLAVPGVLVTAGSVAALVHWGIGLAWSTAGLFGAIVAATDPIAVIAIMRRLGAPHDLAVLVEGESLLNDGTAVVLARIMLGVALAGTASIVDGVLQFALVVGGGLLIGLLMGSAMSRLTARIDDHLLEITLSTILAYGSYISAESLHVSGVIAVVAAGLVLGNLGARRSMSPTTRLTLLNFWEYLAFLLNSLIFLLIGLQVQLGSLLTDLVPIAIAIAAVLLARAVVVYGIGLVVWPLPAELPPRWLHTLFWSGLRGAVSLAVVLSLPLDLPGRPLLLHLTFGVVLWTLLVQGLTMEPLLAWLGLTRREVEHDRYRTYRAQVVMASAAERELERLVTDDVLSPRVAAELQQRYGAIKARLEADLNDLYRDHAHLEADELRTTREQLLIVERSTLQTLQQQGLVGSDIVRQLAARIDGDLITVREGTGTPVPDRTAPAGANDPQPL